MGIEEYSLSLTKNNNTKTLILSAYDSNHAQAQSCDICRAFNVTEFSLEYRKIRASKVSSLFKKLAFNNFNTKTCELWEHPLANKNPCLYLLGSRYYIRTVIIKYLNIPIGKIVKNTCGNNCCINPYHFTYLNEKNSKLTDGDLKLLVAYRSQGTGVNQIAEALNVHRSTIYRKLKNERLSSGAANHSRS